MKKMNMLLAFVATSVMLLTGCQKADKLTIGIMPDLDSIPIVVAEELGYFDESIDIEVYKSAVDRDSAFYSGNLDGSISDVLAACLAQEGEFPVYITSKTYGRYGIVASKDSGVTTAKDLEGKEIGLSLNTIIEYVTDMIIKNASANPDSLSKTSVPKIPSRLELLSNNQIDAIAVPEPYLSAAAEEGNVIVGTSEELGINPGVFIFTEKAMNKKNDKIKAFYEAYNKAIEYMKETDSSVYMPYVIEKVGLPESTLYVELPEYEKSSLPKEDDVMNAMNWLLEKNMISKPMTYNDLVKRIK